MSNLSDIFLAIRALKPEDIRAFAKTAKFAITEEERQRLDSIPAIPEVDEAREIPVTSTYPVIYISSEDLTNATHKITPDTMFPDKPIKTFVQNIDTPVVIDSLDMSIVCYKHLATTDMILVGDTYNGRPINTSPIKITSTRLGEKVVFIFSTRATYHQQGNYQCEKGKFIVVTNFGNIFSGVRNTQATSHCGGFPSYPTYKMGKVNSRDVEVVPSDIESDDEFCRVPQIFVDLMCFTIRSSLPSKDNGWQGPEHSFTVDKNYFKSLCRKYNKDRKDLRDMIREREEHLDAATSNITSLERVIQEREEYIKTLEETTTDLRTRIRNGEDAYVVLIEKMVSEHESFESALKEKEETTALEMDKLGRDIAAEFKRYDELENKYNDLKAKYKQMNSKTVSLIDILSLLMVFFFMCMCVF